MDLEGPDDYVELLSRVEVLEPLSREELVALARRTPVIEIEPSQHLYTPRYRGQSLFLLLEGQMRIYKIVAVREITLEIIETGGMFGEMVFTGEQVQDAYAQATKPSKIAVMGRARFDLLAHEKVEFALKAIELLVERLRLYGDRMSDIALKEVPARLASVILYLIDNEGIEAAEGFTIPTRYTHGQLATMIGAARVAVTRAFNVLGEAGAVELVERRIHVKDIEALKRLARGEIPGRNPPEPGARG